MLKWLNRFKKGVGHKQTAFDPAQFDDPVAVQTEWTQLASRGAFVNFRTHKLVAVDPNKMMFLTTVSVKLWSIILIVPGIYVGFIGFSAIPFDGSFWDIVETVGYTLCFSGLLIGSGAYLFYNCMTPVVFDNRKKLCWKGRSEPKDRDGNYKAESVVEFDQIHALQIISIPYEGESGRIHKVYELNLVLNDGQRIDVIRHGNKKKLVEDARELSHFLMKPLWDATE